MHVESWSQKLKADQFFLGEHGQKWMWCDQSGHGTLKLTVSQKWTDTGPNLEI